MAYLVLARKYRPRTFDEVVGQEEVGRTLKRSIEQDRVGHAYLFSGPRGVGKTSMARIFARALNCPEARDADGRPTGEACNQCPVCADIARGSDVDVLEIDGASNRGIEEVRGIRESAKYLPARTPHKIYIIDEVHMLTGQAFNALLKTLEEPPPHVIFLFATTDPQALPETVRSRCQRFDFRPIGSQAIVRRLEQICEAENVSAETEALALIAELAEGGMRDAQSLLDQMIAYGENGIGRADVERMLGLPPGVLCMDLLGALSRGDAVSALEQAESFFRDGGTPEDLADRLERAARDLLVLATIQARPGDGTHDVPLLSGLDAGALQAASQELFPAEALAYLVRLMLEARSAMREPGPSRVALELALIRAAGLCDLEPLKDVIEAVRKLDAAVAMDSRAAPPERRPTGTGARPGVSPGRPAAQPSRSGSARGAEPGSSASPSAGLAAGRSAPRPTPSGPRSGRDVSGPPPPAPRGAGTTPDRGPTRRPGSDAGAAPSVDAGAGMQAGSVAITDLEEQWSEAVQGILQRKPRLGSFLSRSRLVRFEGDVLTVALPPRNRFGLEQLSQPENDRALKELFCTLTGKALTLQYQLDTPDEPAGRETRSGSDRGPKAPEEGVRRALDMFDGRELPSGSEPDSEK